MGTVIFLGAWAVVVIGIVFVASKMAKKRKGKNNFDDWIA